jgi:hypothetical protein
MGGASAGIATPIARRVTGRDFGDVAFLRHRRHWSRHGATDHSGEQDAYQQDFHDLPPPMLKTPSLLRV